ncbi:MAG TPA: LuxR C-terminal-related transcriptional regulator [Thermomicrobiales bacterium]|nr:LuxR C-terminal-related transcriptional regulator [Thermomicrobiales bacterium]
MRERAAASGALEREHRPTRLTPRELQVLREIAAGKSNREIAAALFLSEKTVERHVSNIYAKSGAENRAAAAAFAIRHGLA